MELFQSTHPVRGATIYASSGVPSAGNFNPRTPHGVRPAGQTAVWLDLPFQSTHPSRGATRIPASKPDRQRIFQSTHPSRGATRSFMIPTPTRRFQSTHPSRGATGYPAPSSRRPGYFNPRTPHGVRLHGQGAKVHLSNFNPRTPHGVRPLLSRNVWCWPSFQSTHPSRGATATAGGRHKLAGISIHAPLTGCDMVMVWGFSDRHSFQSTHPSRGATYQSDVLIAALRFQSTHPSRGATEGSELTPRGQGISIHAPRGGCDRMFSAPKIRPRRISIHAPRGGCDASDWPKRVGPPISIHAPRGGCDDRQKVYLLSDDAFQSTHPVGGATVEIKL